MVFSFVSTVAVGSGWGSLLDFGSPRSAVEVGFPKFCELSAGHSPCLCHWGKFIWEASVKSESGNGGMPVGTASPDEPKSPPENRYQIGHYQGNGMTGRAGGSSGPSVNGGGGVLSGEIVWVAASPVSDWLMSRVQLIWRSPPIWELLKVPIA